MISWVERRVEAGRRLCGRRPGGRAAIIAYRLSGWRWLTVVAGPNGDLPNPPRQGSGPVPWIMGGLVGQLALHVAGFFLRARSCSG
jgi:hypothetical protein